MTDRQARRRKEKKKKKKKKLDSRGCPTASANCAVPVTRRVAAVPATAVHRVFIDEGVGRDVISPTSIECMFGFILDYIFYPLYPLSIILDYAF